jgi:hypothetical protein
MAFVPDCDYDVFVSYAQLNNQPFRWVSTHVNMLESLVKSKAANSEVSFWRDERLAGNAPITPEILTAVRRSAILLVIASTAYIESAWCTAERRAFLDSVRNKPRSDRRIFMVEFDRLDRKTLPSELKDLLSYRFWEEDANTKVSKTLGVPEPSEKEYFNAINSLGVHISDELKALRDRRIPQRSATVFLAETTDDLDAERNEVRNYLEQADLRVVPSSYYPRDDYQAFGLLVRRDLAESNVFVQLLSDVAGRRPDGLPCGYPGLQHDIAVDLKKPVLQWRSRNVNLDAVRERDPAFHAFLNGSHVRACGIAEFKQAVVDEVDLALKPPHLPAPSFNILVFVNADSPDRVLAGTVGQWLHNHDVDVSLPLNHGDPSEIRQDLETNLKSCDAVIIIYGATTAAWVRSQLLQNRKVIADRNTPLLALVVIEGPPPAPPKEDLNITLQNLRTVKCHNGFDDTALSEFLDLLRRSRRGGN